MSCVYAVKSIFRTLQGEGFHAGRAAVFVRTSGCNLWSGREADRTTAHCQFCDTDFLGTDGPGGGRHTAERIVHRMVKLWGKDRAGRFCVLTGGEPALQVDQPLVDRLHDAGFFVAIETNGTRRVRPAVDWITVSPKAGQPIDQFHGDELKVVFPQDGLDLDVLTRLPFPHRYLQPMDGPDRAANTVAAVAYCMEHPQWRLSLQTQKFIGLP